MDKDVGALACAGVLAPFFIISVDRKDETPDVREGMSEKLETIFGRGVS